MDTGSPSESKANPAPDLRSEQGRLNTFRCWPHSAAVSPGHLAKAGFYYLGQADKVRCVFCGGTLKSWQHGDDPLTEHRKHYGSCGFIQERDVGNVPLPAGSSSNATTSNSGASPQPSSSRGLDIGPTEVPANLRLNPCHPDYQSVDTRLATYGNWPAEVTQRPETLAHAGFFYRGDVDLVRCFCCDGALRNWEPGDDPWVEHARWFPRCPYLLQQKGQVFVNEVQDRNLAIQVAEDERSSQNRQALASSEEQQLSDPGLPAVFGGVVEMGFEPQRIQTVLQRLLSSSGMVPSKEELVNALLGENELQMGSGEATAPGAVLVSNSGLSPRPSTAGGASATNQPSQEDDRMLCKICMDREVAVTFLPCGHLVCCSECAKNVKQCPVCRQTVRASVRTYLC